MKGKIEAGGYLHIERKGKFKKQFCPFFAAAGRFSSCGDWCPQFGEPMHIDAGNYSLTICQERRLAFEGFSDERNTK